MMKIVVKYFFILYFSNRIFFSMLKGVWNNRGFTERILHSYLTFFVYILVGLFSETIKT